MSFFLPGPKNDNSRQISRCARCPLSDEPLIDQSICRIRCPVPALTDKTKTVPVLEDMGDGSGRLSHKEVKY